MAYSVNASSDQCYPDTTVLVNKLGLRDPAALEEAEKVVVSLRTVEILQGPPEGPLTFPMYRALHLRLFGDLYEWAGELRTVNLSKKRTNFYPADELDELGTALFDRLQKSGEFRSIPRHQLASQLAEFYHQLNMLHPFREGNGRTQRLFFTLLLSRLGYEINFADCDTDLLLIATIRAAQGVMDDLQTFFETIIQS